MNCDQAFDCLTDSRRRHSAELERHLAACPRCRQMHDTLEPALDLFDGVVEEPDVSALVREPRASGQPESLRVAEQTAARLFAARDPGRRGSDWNGFLRYTTVFVCGAVVVLALGAAQQRFGPDFSPRDEKCLFKREGPDRWRAMSKADAIAACQNCHSENEHQQSDDAAAGRRNNEAGFQQVSRAVQTTSVWLALAEWRRLIGRSPTREETGWRRALALRPVERGPASRACDSPEGTRCAATRTPACGVSAAGVESALLCRAGTPICHDDCLLVSGVLSAESRPSGATGQSRLIPDLRPSDSVRPCA